jgi:hypothetical protein
MKTLKELFDKSENKRYLEALMEFDRGDLPTCNAKVLHIQLIVNGMMIRHFHFAIFTLMNFVFFVYQLTFRLFHIDSTILARIWWCRICRLAKSLRPLAKI